MPQPTIDNKQCSSVTCASRAVEGVTFELESPSSKPDRGRIDRKVFNRESNSKTRLTTIELEFDETASAIYFEFYTQSAETVRGLGVQTVRLTGVYHRDERKRGITVAARCTLRGTILIYTRAESDSSERGSKEL
ncbi:hypothetical protein EVAR_78238_1 [Eumeta japonica]|uniref:Uncharacterized protein n=1 Tax=Eumeta variegata TaxID=151549 RepID=A0A4C1T3T3_EUMVA|nr:hypothetical protein EVAR_78238_1 [Eumeta japonica]